jgi:hypothetical protein
MATLQDYYNIGDTSNLGCGTYSYWGTVFTANQDYDLESVKVLLARIGSSIGDVYLQVMSAPGGRPDPGWNVLASATIDGDAFSTSPVWETFTFGSPISLTSGTQYCIMVLRENDVGTVNWRGDSSGEYAGGNSGRASGTETWQVFGSYDMMFETWSAPSNTVEIEGSIDAVSAIADSALDLNPVDLAGTIAGASTFVATLNDVTIMVEGSIPGVSAIADSTLFISTIHMPAGSFAGTSTMAGTVEKIFEVVDRTTYERLVAFANNTLFYEDI